MGFDAGILAASPVRAPPPPRPPAAAAREGAGVSQGSEPPRPPFLALLEYFLDLFKKGVLERLNPLDRGMLGRTGSAVCTAVMRAGLPRAGGSARGPRVSIRSFSQSLPQFVCADANACPWQIQSTCSAARGGHLEVLRWAREHGCSLDDRTCDFAAEGGHLEVLVCAREQGCQLGASTCAWAAEGGHLQALIWAQDNDCSWDEATCASAARGGRMEVSRWARERGCP